MGLDMSARWLDPNASPQDDDRFPLSSQFHTWRKYYALHAWMEARYRSKGGEGVFDSMEVTSADLDALEAVVLSPPGLDPYPASARDDVRFIRRARKILAGGRLVFYFGSY
jgi:hypothetical protein